MNFMTFHSVGNVIIPTDELIFFRGVGIHQPVIKLSNWRSLHGQMQGTTIEATSWGCPKSAREMGYSSLNVRAHIYYYSCICILNTHTYIHMYIYIYIIYIYINVWPSLMLNPGAKHHQEYCTWKCWREEL